MKYIFIFFICAIVSITSYAQEETDSISFQAENDRLVSKDTIEKQGDTTVVRLGEKRVKIIEEDGETSVIIKKNKDIDKDDKDWDYDWEWDNESPFMDKDVDENGITKFKGHWAGFEFGLNNYVDKNFSISRNAESEFLDLNTSKSWNFNLNFSQYSVPFIGNRFGMVTGIGIEWSNYHFANENTVFKNKTTRRIEALPLSGTIKKNRLQTTYLTVPLLLELQLLNGDRNDRIYISGGVIGGLKIGSNTKYKISESGGDRAEKDKSDFYLHPFRYGVTGRMGYKLVKVYFNYYVTPLFIEDRGPELHPIAMGLTLAF